MLVCPSTRLTLSMTNIDLTEAEKTEGYIGALLPWEVPDTFYNCSGNPPSPLLMKDEKVLTNHPLCVGDRILAIAARTPQALLKAAKAVQISYTILPSVHTIKDALREDAVPIQPHISKNNILAVREACMGDTQKAFDVCRHTCGTPHKVAVPVPGVLPLPAPA